MNRIPTQRWIAAGLLALLPLLVSPVSAQPDTVEEIRVLGLSRMTMRAFLHAFGIQQGEPYDEARIRSRFRSLWELKLFEDIVIESEQGPQGGRIVVVKVKERPVLSAITYEDNKVLTRTQIEDRFAERDVSLAVGKPLDMGQVFFAESAIRDLFAEKGFLDATVKAEVRRVTETSRALNFTMTPGGKTRIRDINFTGNAVFSDRKLKGQLKLTQERKWYWPFSAKNLYHPVKWDQDVGGIRDAYQNRGYLDVEVRAPVVEVRQKDDGKDDKKKGRQGETDEGEPGAPEEDPEPAAPTPIPEPEPLPPDEELTPKQIKKREKQRKKAEEQARKKERKAKAKESKRWVFLSVPVNEGAQYRLGEITITGNEVYSDRLLRAQIPMAEGAVLNNGVLEQGVNRITRLYEDRGYLYSTAIRQILRRENEDVADVEIVVDEDKPYYVGRINFQGNSATHDRVLRRELQLLEGELFSRTRLDVSRVKINQLGYFQVTEEPVIEPVEGENQVQVTFVGQEQGRNEIQVGGGFSGLEGAFFSGVYSTRNFLGRGQVVSAALQIGGRSNRYQLSFQEPWFLGRPYLFGISLFRRDTDFGNSLRSTSSGGGILLGRQLTRFSRINFGYNYEEVTSRSFVAGTSIDDGSGEFESENKISSITPLFAYSTINNPYRPSRGSSLNVSLQVAGGFLGGNTSYIRPQVNFTTYRKGFGRSILAFHAEAGVVRQFGDDAPVAGTSNIEGVPRFQRFWLGGDTLGPRVFETRTITPRRFVCIDDGGTPNDPTDDLIEAVVGDPTGLDPSCFISAGGVPVPIEVGGDRMFLLQGEVVYPMNEQAELAFFVDIGDALFEDTSLDLTTARVSAGIELRFHLPIFPVPLRLIYGVPVRELDGDRSSNFTFSIGRSF